MLSMASSMSVVVVLFTIVAVLIRSIQTFSTGVLPYSENWTAPEPTVPLRPDLIQLIISIPTMFAMYNLFAIIPPYYGSLKVEQHEKK